jgi:hypothetical protein
MTLSIVTDSIETMMGIIIVLADQDYDFFLGPLYPSAKLGASLATCKVSSQVS